MEMMRKLYGIKPNKDMVAFLEMMKEEDKSVVISYSMREDGTDQPYAYTQTSPVRGTIEKVYCARPWPSPVQCGHKVAEVV